MNLQAFIQNQNRVDTVPRFGRKYLLEHWEKVGKTFKPEYQNNDLTIKFINFLCKERNEYYPELIVNPKKGLCIHGDKGLGKTLNFLIYKRILLLEEIRLAKHVKDKNCNSLYATPAFFFLQDMKEIHLNYKKSGVGHYEVLRAKPELVIDDIGIEEINSKDYGSDIDMFGDLLRLRYNQMQRGMYVTHVTTNLTEEELPKRYGDRITDRMNEMFIYILATGESKRS